MTNEQKFEVRDDGPSDIKFIDPDDNTLITLSKGTFYWKGEAVEDTAKVYERFTEWMDSAEVS